MKILNIKGKSKSELKRLLVQVETSDADIDTKERNIENIKRAIGDINSKQDALMQFYESMPEVNDFE